MKSNKLFYLVFLYYSILYQIVFETMIILQGFEITFTPLGRLFRYFVLNQDIEVYYKPDYYVFFFNIFICAILYIVSFNWFIHFNTSKTLLKLIISYVVISFFTWFVIALSGIGLGTLGAFIILYLTPITIIVILTIPFFLLINKITNLKKNAE